VVELAAKTSGPPPQRRDGSRGRQTVVAIYIIAAIAWELMPWVAGNETWWSRASSVLGPWFYLPLPFLALTAALQRDSLSFKALLLPVLLFGAVYGHRFMPSGSSAEGRPLRVMTANLLETNNDARSLMAALTGERADIIAVQELSFTMATRLAREAAETHPYRVLAPSDESFGLGILSRYPVLSSTAPEYGLGKCSCLVAGIQLEDRVVTVVNVHPLAPTIRYLSLGPLDLPIDFESKEVEASLHSLLTKLRGIQGQLLLMGDLNTSDRQPLYRELNLSDSYRTSRDFGFTFPSEGAYGPSFPMIRLDYIFHSDGWSTRSAWTGHLYGSDHRYVVADVVLHH
jgi:endonuclease/exonuclease/phosphatase (EEP) superfamily protein YafD